MSASFRSAVACLHPDPTVDIVIVHMLLLNMCVFGKKAWKNITISITCVITLRQIIREEVRQDAVTVSLLRELID